MRREVEQYFAPKFADKHARSTPPRGVEEDGAGDRRSWWVAAVGGEDESDSSVVVGFDPIATAVDHHVMVEPAQRHQIVGMMTPTMAAGDDVMRLQSMP